MDGGLTLCATSPVLNMLLLKSMFSSKTVHARTFSKAAMPLGLSRRLKRISCRPLSCQQFLGVVIQAEAEKAGAVHGDTVVVQIWISQAKQSSGNGAYGKTAGGSACWLLSRAGQEVAWGKGDMGR